MNRRLVIALDAVLLVVVAYLSFALHGAWTAPERPASVPPAQAGSPATPDAVSGPPAPPPPLQTFAVVADRNLFNPNRVETSPEPPKPAGRPAAATPPAPKPRLYGIVVLPDGKSRAYLEDAQRKKVFGFSVGDSVAESRLEQIKNDRVVLRRGSEVYEVLLRDPTKPKPAAPPAVAATNPFAAAAAAMRGQEKPPDGQPPGAGPPPPGSPPGATNPFRSRPPGGAGVAPAAPGTPGFNPFLQGAARRRPPLANPAAPAAPPAPAPATPEAQDDEEEESQ